MVASNIVIMALYLIFMEPILTLFGCKVIEQTYALSNEYFFWFTLGIPFYMFGLSMNPIIRSDGNPKFAMISTVIGAVANQQCSYHGKVYLQSKAQVPFFR